MKYQAYHAFLVQSERNTLSDLNSGSMLSGIPGRILIKNWSELLSISHVWEMQLIQFAVSPPGSTLDDINEKFKWLCGSIESFDTLMQEFY